MTSPDPPLPSSSPGASGASPTSPPASAAPVAPAAPPASAAGAATPDEGPAPEPVPFPEALLHPAIEAAASLWEPLAARAWAETARRGRGLLAMRWEELEATAAAARTHRGAPAEPGEPGEPGESGDPANPASPAAARPTRSPEPPATWIPLSIVSRGDDFRGLLKTYDPRRQVMLLVAHADGGEAVFGLECDGERRPAPDVCHARRMEHAEAGAAPDASAASPASPASPGDPPATASAPDA